jgi:hypothetical protein
VRCQKLLGGGPRCRAAFALAQDLRLCRCALFPELTFWMAHRELAQDTLGHVWSTIAERLVRVPEQSHLLREAIARPA